MSGEVTQLLAAWGAGDRSALDQLIPLVEGELRRVAHRFVSRERSDHTLQTTALVNEAYLRLVGQREARWENRAQFFAIAARMMRRILVDHARALSYAKRGGGAEKVPLEDTFMSQQRTTELLALDDALDALARVDEQKARVVEMRYFGGLTVEETAEVLHVHPDTVTREWRRARAFLRREMTGDSHAN